MGTIPMMEPGVFSFYVLYCRQSDWDRPPLTFIGACGPMRDAQGALESGDRPP